MSCLKIFCFCLSVVFCIIFCFRFAKKIFEYFCSEGRPLCQLPYLRSSRDTSSVCSDNLDWAESGLIWLSQLWQWWFYFLPYQFLKVQHRSHYIFIQCALQSDSVPVHHVAQTLGLKHIKQLSTIYWLNLFCRYVVVGNSVGNVWKILCQCWGCISLCVHIWLVPYMYPQCWCQYMFICVQGRSHTGILCHFWWVLFRIRIILMMCK